METEKNKKSKFLSFPVNWVVALVLAVLGSLGFLLFEALTPEYIERPRETHFVCGTCEDLRHGRENLSFGSEKAKTLFKANCSPCHTSTQRPTIGPGLMGVLDRIPGGNWKYHFVRNEDSMFAAGDAYTVMLRENYQDVNCMEFPILTNDEIDEILQGVSR